MVNPLCMLIINVREYFFLACYVRVFWCIYTQVYVSTLNISKYFFKSRTPFLFSQK